jgi:hypothetical protein
MESQPGESVSRAGEVKPFSGRSKTLNLGNVVGDDDLDFSVKTREDPDERQARLRREEADAEHQRRKELLILRAVLITLGVTALVCIGVIVIPGSPPENAKWATTLLTIVSAGVGYMTGKSSK